MVQALQNPPLCISIVTYVLLYNDIFSGAKVVRFSALFAYDKKRRQKQRKSYFYSIIVQTSRINKLQ
jgi:hypothetical protein